MSGQQITTVGGGLVSELAARVRPLLVAAGRRLRQPRVLRRLALVLMAAGLGVMWLPGAAFAVGVCLCVLGLAFLVGWELAR